MKQLLILLIMISLAACAHRPVVSANKDATSINSTAQTNDSTTRDGSSFQKAIIIQETHESPGIAAEYKWIRDHYPGYASQSQSLIMSNKVPYDVLHIKNADGDQKNVYFDISKYYGNW